ncbi:MAG: putative metal-binding motif-containing protein [Deltaproteobacteria bacterium]|nr:putative metal-binding motif-containing protein [Deltaproteobacteria bacterium]
MTDQDCDDRAFCNGAETCQEERCIPGAPLVCLGSTACSTVACDEEARACRTTPATEDRDRDGFRAPRPGTSPGSPDRCGDDCDDDDPEVHPGAVERCNGVDDDCNGIIDDNATLTPTGDAVRVSEAAVAPSGPGGVQWTGSRYGVSYWGYDSGRAHVYFRQIDRTGAPSAMQQQVTTTPNDAFGAALAWNGRVLGAVWQDRRDPSGGYEIYFNRLTPGGRAARARPAHLLRAGLLHQPQHRVDGGGVRAGLAGRARLRGRRGATRCTRSASTPRGGSSSPIRG